jgi:hypothetical protein
MLVLSVAGDYWPWYLGAAIIATVPIVNGPARYRVLGTAALVLSLVLTWLDYSGGQRRHQSRRPRTDQLP